MQLELCASRRLQMSADELIKHDALACQETQFCDVIPQYTSQILKLWLRQENRFLTMSSYYSLFLMSQMHPSVRNGRQRKSFGEKPPDLLEICDKHITLWCPWRNCAQVQIDFASQNKTWRVQIALMTKLVCATFKTNCTDPAFEVRESKLHWKEALIFTRNCVVCPVVKYELRQKASVFYCER